MRRTVYIRWVRLLMRLHLLIWLPVRSCTSKCQTSLNKQPLFRKNKHGWVSHTCFLSSGRPCHVTDTSGGMFGGVGGVGVGVGGGGGGCCCFFPPNPTPSLCPPDGCQLECSVTGLFLDEATWNTPTEASLRINTSCSRAVWHVWPDFCSNLTWDFLGIFKYFFSTSKTSSLPSLLTHHSDPAVLRPVLIVSSDLVKVPEAPEMSPEDRGAGLR